MTQPLLLQVAAGRTDAVDGCIRRFSGPIWSLARRFSANEHDAEDAVQEIFLDLWKSAARYDPQAGSEMTFVLTIARRRLIDRGRRRGRAPAVQSLEDAGAMLADAREGDPVEVRDEAARVREALSRLRPEQQRVLELSFVHGHTHQQVAERTGLPLGTVKSHARRGLMKVRELLAAEPGAGSRS